MGEVDARNAAQLPFGGADAGDEVHGVEHRLEERDAHRSALHRDDAGEVVLHAAEAVLVGFEEPHLGRVRRSGLDGVALFQNQQHHGDDQEQRQQDRREGQRHGDDGDGPGPMPEALQPRLPGRCRLSHRGQVLFGGDLVDDPDPQLSR